MEGHHESHTRLHNIWCGMRKRCRKHIRYAGNGIKVCDDWEDYKTFAKWARENGYEDNLTIERIDVDGDYCPQNCKWIPLGEQSRNRHTTRWVEWNGRKMSLSKAAEISGIPYYQVHFRLKNGWTLEDALTKPLFKKSDLHKKCDELGLNYHTVYNRIRMGWSEEDALNTPIVGIGANQTTYKK